LKGEPAAAAAGKKVIFQTAAGKQNFSHRPEAATKQKW